MGRWLFGVICYLTLLAIQVSGDQAQQSKITLFFSNRCQKYSSNAQHYDKLRIDAEDLKKYSKYAFAYLPKNKEHFCKNERRHLSGRMRAMADNLKNCLPAEEQYLPDFLTQLFDAFLHFLCHNNGENIDNFFSSHGEECRTRVLSENIDECFQRIFPPAQSTVTKSEICEDIKVAEKCFSQTLDKRCPDFRAFQELNNNFFRYLNKPCSTSATRSSGASVQALPITLFITVLYLFKLF